MVLEQLSSGTTRVAVAAIDLPGARRAAEFSELFRDGALTAWLVVPDAPQRANSIGSYLENIANDVLEIEADLLCISDFCSSVALVAEVSQMVRRRRTVDVCALFNPYRVDGDFVREAYLDIARQTLLPEWVDAAPLELIDLIQDSPLLDGDLPADLVDELRARYVGWVALLGVAAGIPLDFGDLDLLVYSSSMDPEVSPVVTRGEIRQSEFSVPMEALLASDEVAECLVRDLSELGPGR